MLTVHALAGGFLELDRRSMIPDAPAARWTVPVLCVLVTHPRGRLLFDTGMHCQTMTDATARLGERAKFFGFHTKPGEDVVSQLVTLGVTPGDVVPGVVWDAAEMKTSFASLRAMRDRQGATMFYGHEPAQWPDRAAFPSAIA